MNNPRSSTRLVAAWLLSILVVVTASTSAHGAGHVPLERSFWVHASLGLFTQQNYFGTNYPGTPLPEQQQVGNAARLLGRDCAANRIYLIYHRELPVDDARRLFTWWRQACSNTVEIVPALVLRMYDRDQTPVFATKELAELTDFFHERINPRRLAIYDIAARRNPGEAEALLARKFPGGLIRLGLQPGEVIKPLFSAAVHDTWSALCHGRRNEEDWRQPGFGAGTLRQWVVARNSGPQRVAWNLVTVAWDYSATERGGHPGYDDAEKNMPLPVGRNRQASQLIRAAARTEALAGFSSDLYILHENSRPARHDGKAGAFYECLKRGEHYHGYFGGPWQEIVSLYRELRDRGE